MTVITKSIVKFQVYTVKEVWFFKSLICNVVTVYIFFQLVIVVGYVGC